MEYKLCKDNLICCDNDCRRCANLVHGSLTNENKSLKMRLDTLTEKCDRQVEAHNKLYDAYWRVKGERDKIHDELKELKSKKMVPLSEVYRIIAGHNDYHGGNILSALTCIAEGKYVDPVATYKPVNDALTDENKRLKAELKKFEDKCQELEEQLEWAKEDIESLHKDYMEKNSELEKENSALDKENEMLHKANQELYDRLEYYRGNDICKENKELIDKCQELEKKNAWLEKECEKLRDDNHRFAGECRYYIERESELMMENDKLRMMNSKLLYRNGQLMNKSDPVIFQHAYGELNDKIESLKEDIIRLDKCLSNRQCVKEERYGE